MSLDDSIQQKLTPELMSLALAKNCTNRDTEEKMPYSPPQGDLASIIARNSELDAQLNSMRAERDHMADIQHQLMELLGTHAPERLLHDLRNVLNERDLYRALADIAEE